MSISELFSVADSDQASLCSVSTNATEDNLPGPGRTIGLFYNFAGRHLEVQLGRAAERMGHGSRGAGIMTGNTCTDLGLVSENLEPLLCPSDQASLHSVSTNATADNLPGAGRTLGLFYSFAGKHLEARLGRLAGILGRGPRATALRIQENQGVVALASVLPLPLSPTKARNKKIQKDCKHLLKYVGSNALSTRGQALDLIIDLSLDDHIRNFLKAVGAVHLIEQAHKELFIRSDFDLSLLSRSRKALVTVADDVLMNEIKTIGESEEEALYFRSDKISYYLRDPDRSFIVVRCLVQLFSPHRKDDFFFFQMCQHVFLEHMVIAIETSPEWESVDQLLNNIFVRREDLLWPYFDDFRLIGLALEIALQHADMLPRTIGSETFQWLIKDCVFTEDNVTDNDGLIHAVWTVIILRNLLRQNNTAGMELGCIDFKRIRDLYPHIVLQPLFARLSSAPDLIYYQIVHERTGDVEHSPISWVVQSDTLRMLSQELAFFADSENKLLSNRARRCIASLLVLDIYCRTAILQALSTTRYASTREFTLLIETRQVRNFVAKELFSGGRPYRHCDAGGNLVHVCDYNCTEDYIGGKKHELRLSIEAVLELHIQRGEAFSCAGHHPIIAGRTANGEIAYVAVARFKSYGGRYCTVTEGMKPENLYLAVRDPDSNVVRMRTPKSFIVYVLRYAPAEYTTNMDWNFYGASAELDLTGPFSQKPEKDNEGDGSKEEDRKTDEEESIFTPARSG